MNKAIVIGVAIFITISITSGIMYTISKIRDIYKEVYETDTAISNRFSEFDAYDNSTKTGLEVINTVNKYKGNSNVKTFFRGTEVNSASIDINNFKGKVDQRFDIYFNEEYNSKLTINNDDTIIINFT